MTLVASFLALDVDPSLASDGDFVVDVAYDDVDSDPGDGDCENASEAQDCSLRAAIQEANEHSGTDTIPFAAGITTVWVAR